MIRHIELNPVKTYATRENAVAAVNKRFGARVTSDNGENISYIISINAEGRFFPVFLGERALQAGMHFSFCVAN